MFSPCDAEAQLILDLSIGALRDLPAASSTPDAVAQRIVSLLAQDDMTAARALLADGTNGDTLTAAVVAAARQAEKSWKQGLLGFDAAVAVFAGLDHLLRIHRTDRPAKALAPRLIMVVPQGERHSLGARVAGLRLADAGITLHAGTAIPTDTALDLVSAGTVDAVGLSVGCDTALDGLAEIIARLRQAAPDPGLRVILGGAAITLPEQAYAFAGADLVTNDIAAAAAFLVAADRCRGLVN